MSTKQNDILHDRNYMPVANAGFVGLVNHWGSDELIERVARSSYDMGKRPVSDTRTLLRYLMRHKHMGPFEFAGAVFHIKCPLFVARQIFRHRTGSFNEISARYSLIEDEFWIPEVKDIRSQSKKNKQASGSAMFDNADVAIDTIVKSQTDSFEKYEYLIDLGVSREVSRSVIPVGTYTEFFIQLNLRNLLWFLSLRYEISERDFSGQPEELHVQSQTREYANKVYALISEKYPITFEAWNDYHLEAITFSSLEIQVIAKALLSNMENITEELSKNETMGRREKEELISKLHKIERRNYE